MKWLLFSMFIVLGVPFMTGLATWSRKGRLLLVAALVSSTVLKISVNIASRESYRGPDRGFEISLTDLIAVSLALGILLTQGRRIHWLPMNILLYVMYVAVAAISAFQAPDQQLAFFTLFKWTKTVVLYWAVFNCFWLEWPMGGAILGIITAAGIETAIAFKQKYLIGMYRIHGTFDHSNTIPAYFLMIIPILLVWLMADTRGRLTTMMGVMALFGMCFVVAATMSRAGLALMGVSILGPLAVTLARKPNATNWALTALFGLAFTAGAAKAVDSFIQRFQEAPESSAEARDEFNIAADLMASQNTFGVGINCFSQVLTNDARYRDSISVMKNEEHAGVCHHIYKLTAAEMGYLGLTLLILIYARFLWVSARFAFGRHGQERLVLLGALTGASAVHAVGLLEWVFRVTPVWNLFWITSALAAATSQRIARGIQSPCASHSLIGGTT